MEPTHHLLTRRCGGRRACRAHARPAPVDHTLAVGPSGCARVGSGAGWGVGYQLALARLRTPSKTDLEQLVGVRLGTGLSLTAAANSTPVMVVPDHCAVSNNVRASDQLNMLARRFGCTKKAVKDGMCEFFECVVRSACNNGSSVVFPGFASLKIKMRPASRKLKRRGFLARNRRSVCAITSVRQTRASATVVLHQHATRLIDRFYAERRTRLTAHETVTSELLGPNWKDNPSSGYTSSSSYDGSP